MGLLHRGGHRDDEDVGGFQVLQIAAVAQVLCLRQLGWAAFQCVVLPTLQLCDALRVDVETNDLTKLAKLYSQRQSDVAEADDGDGFHFFHFPLTKLAKYRP